MKQGFLKNLHKSLYYDESIHCLIDGNVRKATEQDIEALREYADIELPQDYVRV